MFIGVKIEKLSVFKRLKTDIFGYKRLNTESGLEVATHLHRQNNKAFIDEKQKINY